MPVGAAIGVSGALGAGASIFGASKAAGAAQSAAAANNALLEQIYNSNKGLETPFINFGTAAGGEIAGLLGIGGDPASAAKAFDVYKGSTGYQTTINAGTDALNSNAATAGLLKSGANLKNINTFGQATGQSYFNQYLNQLGGQEQIGVGAANALAGQGNTYAGMVSANNNSAASATGNAYLSGAGSLNSLLGSLTSAYGYSQGASSYGGGSGFGIPAGYQGLT